jgi:hypothetical protein
MIAPSIPSPYSAWKKSPLDDLLRDLRHRARVAALHALEGRVGRLRARMGCGRALGPGARRAARGQGQHAEHGKAGDGVTNWSIGS